MAESRLLPIAAVEESSLREFEADLRNEHVLGHNATLESLLAGWRNAALTILDDDWWGPDDYTFDALRVRDSLAASYQQSPAWLQPRLADALAEWDEAFRSATEPDEAGLERGDNSHPQRTRSGGPRRREAWVRSLSPPRRQ